MRSLFSLLAGIALLPTIANAQIHVGSNKVALLNVAGKMNDQDIAQLRKTTTIFLLQDADYSNITEWENAIKSVWTITPFKIVTRSEASKYNSGNYSYFMLGGYVVSSGQSTPIKFKNQTQNALRVTYDLWMPKGDDGEYFARVQLYPDNATMYDAATTYMNKKERSSIGENLYTQTKLHSWSPYMLKGYLKTVNDHILAGEQRGPYSEEQDVKGLAALKTDTLYIPDYVNIKFNLITTKDKYEDTDVKELKASYPYPVRVLPKEELAQIINKSSKPVYYLVYAKATMDKFINVYEAKSGKLLYARHNSYGHNFKYSDLKDLQKVIKD